MNFYNQTNSLAPQQSIDPYYHFNWVPAHVPNGQLSLQNQFRKAKIGNIENKQLREGIMLVHNRINQIKNYKNKLSQKMNQLEMHITTLKELFLQKISQYKEAALTSSRIQKHISKVNQDLLEFDRVTNDYFLIFMNSYSERRLPKVISPNSFIVKVVDRIHTQVNQLLQKIKQAQLQIEAQESCQTIQVIEALWEYLLAVAGRIFDFKDRFNLYKQQLVVKKGLNLQQLQREVNLIKHSEWTNNYVHLQSLQWGEQAIAAIGCKQVVLK